MVQVKTVADWMVERAVGLAELVATSRLDQRVIEAIVHGQYTPSPWQRQSIASALGVTPEQVAWDHQVQVEHFYGHGEQFGRSP